MTVATDRTRIVTAITGLGWVEVPHLCALLGAPWARVRRDLRWLADRGEVERRRTSGGVRGRSCAMASQAPAGQGEVADEDSRRTRTW